MIAYIRRFVHDKYDVEILFGAHAPSKDMPELESMALGRTHIIQYLAPKSSVRFYIPVGRYCILHPARPWPHTLLDTSPLLSSLIHISLGTQKHKAMFPQLTQRHKARLAQLTLPKTLHNVQEVVHRGGHKNGVVQGPVNANSSTTR